MATTLYRRKGDQFFTASGAPLNGGKLYFYEAGTTTLQHTYSDAAGLVQNTNPVVLGSDGRLQTAVYFGDTASHEDYKEELKTSLDVTVSPWPFDDIPAATPEASGDIFAAPSFPWEQVSAGTINLTAADTGSAYEADTTSGNVTFNLPSAASAGNGKGFAFKKTAAANSMIIDPAGSETIDDVSTALTITAKDSIIGIFSNGAEWYLVDGVLTGDNLLRLFGAVPTDALPDAGADFIITQDISTGLTSKALIRNIQGKRYIASGAIAAAATLDLTIPANCDVMEIDLWNVIPATDNAAFFMRFSQSATFLAGASDYKWGGTVASAAASDDADSEIELMQGWGNAAGEFGHLCIRIFRPNAAATVKSALWHGAYHNTLGAYVSVDAGGELLANTNAIDGVRFLFSSGNIASGFYAVTAYRYA